MKDLPRFVAPFHVLRAVQWLYSEAPREDLEGELRTKT